MKARRASPSQFWNQNDILINLLLDHFFILTQFGAEHAELLSNLGLIEGAGNDHPGQGTSNRRFFLLEFYD